MKKNPVLYVVAFVVLMFWLFWGCAVILSGCAVTKGKEEKQIHTVAVDTVIAGKVSESKTTVSTDWEWYRTTLLSQQPHGDTIINKNYYTSNMPAPQVIIMEGGKGKQEAITENKDSIWENRFARLESVLTEKSKTKETQVLSMWQIIGIAGAAVVIAVILSKLKLHF